MSDKELIAKLKAENERLRTSSELAANIVREIQVICRGWLELLNEQRQATEYESEMQDE